MFKKKKENVNEQLIFKTENYIMSDKYEIKNLVVANLEYISSCYTPNGLMVETTKQKYIFEVINIDSNTKYREIFTGFIADTETSYFDLPYVSNIKPLKEVVTKIADNIPKYGLLLLMNEINFTEKEKVYKK